MRRLEQIAPDLVDRLAATIGDHTTHGCIAAMLAMIALYRQLRAAYPDLRRHRSAEEAAMTYLDEIETRIVE